MVILRHLYGTQMPAPWCLFQTRGRTYSMLKTCWQSSRLAEFPKWRSLHQGSEWYLSTCVKHTSGSICSGVSARHTFCTASGVPHDKQPVKASNEEPRVNCINIEMLPHNLHQQVFKHKDPQHLLQADAKLHKVVNKHLLNHNVGGKVDLQSDSSDLSKDLVLPDLLGGNIDSHFRHLATQQSAPYWELAETLASCELPALPKSWSFEPGWTRYGKDGSVSQVEFPEDEGLVFDVETLMQEGGFPTMATAASSKAWYSWCSDRLIKPNSSSQSERIQLNDLINLESSSDALPQDVSWVPRFVIGHNVGFDRSFIKEQYYLECSKMRFFDTLSLHMCVNGMTSFQRVLFMAHRKGSNRKEIHERREKKRMLGLPSDEEEPGAWLDSSSLNNLNDVYQLHCKGPPLKKEQRDVFMEGNMADVRRKFQDLMTYCANDVLATQQVFKVLWPVFRERFPHPVTFAGMLEMMTAYLPVTPTWQRYKRMAQSTYEDLQMQAKRYLMSVADEACAMKHNKKYAEDPWLWDLDWSEKSFKNSAKVTKMIKENAPVPKSKADRLKAIHEAVEANTRKRPVHMPGYPKWYAELCPTALEQSTQGLPPGPSKVSTMKRVVPKLLRLTWQGFPLHYDATHGWGYLVPGKDSMEDEAHIMDCQETGRPVFPLRAALQVCKPVLVKSISDVEISRSEFNHLHDYMTMRGLTDDESQQLWLKLQPREEEEEEDMKPKKSWPSRDEGPHWHQGNGPYNDVEVLGCWFFKMPHKDGDSKRVGNPMSKDFISKFEDGTMASALGSQADVLAKLSKICMYWKNNMDRIKGQLAVPLSEEYLPDFVKSDAEYYRDYELGAILPRLMPAGTITRRSVEPTWMTASNAYVDRVGSELKSMVNSPPGYRFVGADVDSQELWIAAVLADSHFAGIHGCTAFSWMTLQGNKADGTDLHSQTAKIMGITRDQAKVFNYGRIYGAGETFAKKLLAQFNHLLSKTEVATKVTAMFRFTKGRKRTVYYHDPTVKIDEFHDHFGEEAMASKKMWEGGSESALFNKLEEIANNPHPCTPVLGCHISKALEPASVNKDFLTSRVNWVIQSSAVDYLHLMLVCMRWLISEHNINARFCISIHDEVRYLVAEEDAYRAALALQITNLLTRSMFAYRLGMPDLPKSVAFFSSVDIDRCLRKEAHMDCVTPSNPHGMEKGYGIPPGESLTMADIMKITKGCLQKNTQPSDMEGQGSENTKETHHMSSL